MTFQLETLGKSTQNDNDPFVQRRSLEGLISHKTPHSSKKLAEVPFLSTLEAKDKLFLFASRHVGD